jgi:hypothetical protein
MKSCRKLWLLFLLEWLETEKLHEIITGFRAVFLRAHSLRNNRYVAQCQSGAGGLLLWQRRG